jgi:hypothetical protein
VDSSADLTLEQLLPFLDELLDPAALLDQVMAGSGLGDDLVDFVKRVLNLPGDFVGWLWDRFTDVYNWIEGEGRAIYDGIGAHIDSAFGIIGAAVSDVAHTVWDAIAWVVGQVGSLLSPVYDALGNVIDFVGGLGQSILGWIEDAVSNIVGFVGGLGQSVLGWIENASGNIIAFVQGAVGWLGDQVNAVPGLIIDFVHGAIDWLGGQVDQFAKDIADHVSAVGNYVGETVFNTVIAGAESLGAGFLDGLTYLVDKAFEPIAPDLSVLLSMPRKFASGAYDDLDAFFADLEHPSMTGGIGGLLLSMVALPAMLTTMEGALGSVKAEGFRQVLLQKMGHTLPTAADARDAVLRKLITDEEHVDILGRTGLTPERIAWLKQLDYDLPAHGDLLHIAGRGAFDDGIAGAWALDAELPENYSRIAAEVGLHPDWPPFYWRAHWTLPSLGEAEEMLHRGVIDEAQLRQLMAVHGVAPGWRDNLVQIASNLLPVRSLRQMYQTGVITADELHQAYLDLGFAPANADRLVELAKRLAAGTPKTLPSGMILTAYRDGELPRATAETELTALGFNPDDVAFMLDLEDLANAREIRNLEESIIEADYKAGLIDETRATANLAEFGVPQDRAGLLVLKWRNRKAARVAQLSVGQVQRLYRDGVISVPQALGRFHTLGYNEEDARHLLELALKEPSIPSTPELTPAQLFAAFHRKLLTEDQLRARLAARGYPADEIAILVTLADPDPAPKAAPELTIAELVKAVKGKVLDVAQFIDRLTARGYAADDIDVYVRTEKLGAAPAGA